MSDGYGADEVRSALVRTAEALRENADAFTRLDQALGDGDLGITARKVADALVAHAEGASPAEDLGGFIAAAGMATNRAASSTMGTLLATAGMRAGKLVKGAARLTDAQLTAMLQAAAEGMRERGKASLGDKTILDALFPAAEAFAAALEAGMPVEAAGRAMVRAAEEGRDAVTPLRNKIGRAGWIGERTEGLVDPGCELCVVVLRALARA